MDPSVIEAMAAAIERRLRERLPPRCTTRMVREAVVDLFEHGEPIVMPDPETGCVTVLVPAPPIAELIQVTGPSPHEEPRVTFDPESGILSAVVSA